jgi:hypothetical protein
MIGDGPGPRIPWEGPYPLPIPPIREPFPGDYDGIEPGSRPDDPRRDPGSIPS